MDLIASSLAGGSFSPERIAALLRTTKEEVEATAGLSRDAVARRARVGSPATKTRLRELVEILARIEPWAGSALAAYAGTARSPCRALQAAPPRCWSAKVTPPPCAPISTWRSAASLDAPTRQRSASSRPKKVGDLRCRPHASTRARPAPQPRSTATSWFGPNGINALGHATVSYAPRES